MFSLATSPVLALVMYTIGVNAVNAHDDHSPCVQGSYVMADVSYETQVPNDNSPYNKRLPLCHNWTDSDPPFQSFSAHLKKDPRTLTMRDCPLVTFSEPNCKGERRMHGVLSAIPENCVTMDDTWGRSFYFDCSLKDHWQQHIPRETVPVPTSTHWMEVGPPLFSRRAILPRDGRTVTIDGHTTTTAWDTTGEGHKLDVAGAGHVEDPRFNGKTLTLDGYTTTVPFNTFEYVASHLRAEKTATTTVPSTFNTFEYVASHLRAEKTPTTTPFNTFEYVASHLRAEEKTKTTTTRPKTKRATAPPRNGQWEHDTFTTMTRPTRDVKPTLTTTVEVSVVDLGPVTTKGRSPQHDKASPTTHASPVTAI